jgi:hypothetical protein
VPGGLGLGSDNREGLVDEGVHECTLAGIWATDDGDEACLVGGEVLSEIGYLVDFFEFGEEVGRRGEEWVGGEGVILREGDGVVFFLVLVLITFLLESIGAVVTVEMRKQWVLGELGAVRYMCFAFYTG